MTEMHERDEIKNFLSKIDLASSGLDSGGGGGGVDTVFWLRVPFQVEDLHDVTSHKAQAHNMVMLQI